MGYHRRAMKTFRNAARAAATLMVVAALAFIGASGGCSSKLETGYKPRLLGSSPETRRGYYAQPFTPEAKKAKQYEQEYGTNGGAGTNIRPRPND